MRRTLLSLMLVLALGAVLAVGLAGRHAAPAAGGADSRGALHRYFAAHGLEETGAVNLVSSIYLGYRAFDTLGETVVLFLAVTGVMVLRGGRP